MKKETVLITGSTGLVGGYIADKMQSLYDILSPSREECDITDCKNFNAYIAFHSPSVVIHAAAFTDNMKAEKERGDSAGECWQINVEGTRHIVDAAKKIGAFVVFISTGSVFTGNEDITGPFAEFDTISSEEVLSWYAWTKAVAETIIKEGAIVRLSHPIGKSLKSDYIHQLLHLYNTNTLYPLFTDQYFPLTDMDDLVMGIEKIINNKRKKIYHMVSRDVVTPYELVAYVLQKRGNRNPNLPSITFDTFIKTSILPKRFSKYSALDGVWSRAELQLANYSWRDVVDKL
jgi:dTDP-4-dehydrorhamnose reductase